MSESRKLSHMKTVLMRAWRERWPDTQWSIHTKPHVTEPNDATLLADLLIQQATVGLSGNHLFLSYFKHAVNTQLISCTVGIESISKMDDVSKVYCVKALMELALTIVPNIGMKGNFEDSWKLVKASMQMLRWVVQCMRGCVSKVQEDLQSAEYSTVINKAREVLDVFSGNNAVRALLHIAYLDETELYNGVKESAYKTKTILSKIQSTHLKTSELMQSMDFINALSSLPKHTKPILECHYHMLNPSINVLLHYEATLNSTSQIPPIAEQLLLIEKLQGLERADLYCEALRSCYMGMINSVGTPEELKWAAFVFLKMPHIMLAISRTEGPQNAVEQALNKFLHYVPLLKLADTKCGTDCLQLLVNELRKNTVISDGVAERVLLRRKEESKKAIKHEQTATVQQPMANLILRAEPTISSILKTLDQDYSRNQEGLFGVLGHMMTGKSFELILNAAAATNKLHAFVFELIRFNEFARSCSGEGGRQAYTRSLMFDTSFLMLCHIAQTYGLQPFPSSSDGSGNLNIDRMGNNLEDAFFVQWAHRSMPEDGQYKALDLLLPPDEHKVDSLMQQLQPGNEIKISLAKWNEVYSNAPYAMREILNAWEYGVVSQDQVQVFVNNIKSKMCSLAVVITSHLCSYIQCVEEELRAKPIAMVEMLAQGGGTPATPPPSQDPNAPTPNTYYTERSNVMQLVISNMIQGILPQGSKLKKQSPHILPPVKPLTEMLLETWTQVFTRGCITNLDLQKFEHLLNIGGAQWMCESLVKETLSKDRPEDLYKGVSLLYSLFNLDLQALTLSLLHYTLPGLLSSQGKRLEMLSGPRALVLSKLCIMLICLMQKMNAHRDSCQTKSGRKRTRTEIELEDSSGEGDFEMRPSKMRKTEGAPKSLTQSFTNDGFSLDEDDSVLQIPDPLNVALGNLFKLFNSIVVGDELSQKSQFVQSFIQEVIKCDPGTTSFIAQFIPPNMISQLLRSMPSQFNFDVVLSMCNLTNVQGRRIAAKIICQNERLRRELESPLSIVASVRSVEHSESIGIAFKADPGSVRSSIGEQPVNA